MKPVALLPVLLVCVLSACGKTEHPIDASADSNGITRAEVAEGESAKQPAVDRNVPLEQYVNVAYHDDGDATTKQFFDLVALNGALSQVDPALPVDYDMLAKMASRDYYETQDAFKKKEMLDSLKPKLAERMEYFKRSPYVSAVYKYKNNVEAYDFNQKGFPLNIFKENLTLNAGYTGFGNSGQMVNLDLKNENAASVFVVADQQLAASIESMRTDGKAPYVKVYYAAQTKPQNELATAFHHYMTNQIPVTVTHMQFIDRSGNVIADFSPEEGGSAFTSEAQTPADAASSIASDFGF